MDWNVDPFEGLTPTQIARATAAYALDNAMHAAAKKLVRLYYKTKAGSLRAKEFMAWTNPHDRDYFGYVYGKHPAGRYVDRPKRMDDTELRRKGYLPSGATSVKLVAVRKNGKDGRLVIKGTKYR